MQGALAAIGDGLFGERTNENHRVGLLLGAVIRGYCTNASPANDS